MSFSNPSSSPKSTGSSEGASQYTSRPVNGNNVVVHPYEQKHIIVYNPFKKVKTENNSQTCVVKQDHKQMHFNAPFLVNSPPEFTQTSSGIPYLLKRPQQISQPIPKPQRMNNLKEQIYNLDAFVNHAYHNMSSMNAKRRHPEFTIPTPRLPIQEAIKRPHPRVIHKREELNRNIPQMMPPFNAPFNVPRPNLGYNDLLLSQNQFKNSAISELSMIQNLEQQLKNLSEFRKRLQLAQSAEILRTNPQFAQIKQGILPPNLQKSPELQPQAIKIIKRCLIEEVTASEKNFTQAEEHLGKRHQANYVRKIETGGVEKKDKVFEFSTTKFNLTINKKKGENKENEASSLGVLNTSLLHKNSAPQAGIQLRSANIQNKTNITHPPEFDVRGIVNEQTWIQGKTFKL